MDAAQPGLEIGEHEMDDGQKGFRDFHVAALRDGGMKVSAFTERRIAALVVGNNGGAGCRGAFDEADQRLGASVWHQSKPDTTGVPPGLATGALALPDFDGAGHERHVVDASSFAARAAANPSFVGFDDLFRFAPDPVLVGAHPAGAQLVEYLECGFVARQPELVLELEGRHAGHLAGNQVRGPELDRKRRVRALHDGACSEARVPFAMATPENAETIGKAVRLAMRTAVVTDEPITPSGALKIGHARSFVRKQSLEFRKRAWKRQVVSPKHVDHGCHRSEQMTNILPVVGLGDNPISTGASMKMGVVE